MGDQIAAFSLASVVPSALSAPSTPASGLNSSRKLRTSAGSRLSGPISSIRSFRRKKYVRQCLIPLTDGEPRFTEAVQPGAAARRPSRDRNRRYERESGGGNRSGGDNGSVDGDRGRSTESREKLVDYDNDDEEDSPASEIDRLQRFHATLSSPEHIQQWILTYESDKQRFASFAVFAEMKLDEIRDAVVGRPNAVEVAACFASLVKIPGLVGCYSELLEKLAAGIQSAIYLPDEPEIWAPSTATPVISSASSMAILVQSFFGRKTYFAHVRALETQLFEQRSIRDVSVLRSLTVDEVVSVLVHAPLSQLQCAFAKIGAQESGSESPRFEQLFLFMSEKQNDRLRTMHVHKAIHDDEDETYPFFLPLASSAQICRAVASSASSFSASGKEMILCAILEFVDADAFKDVFKRFDAHAKALFLHHLSITESSEHLQTIVSQLPNAGDVVFRFYNAACGAQSEPTGVAKQTLFLKLLSAETEYFFLCDLAAYLSEEQFLLLSREYEKSVQERKRLRRKRRGTSLSEADGSFADDIDEDDDEGDSGGDGNSGGRSAKSTLESFQLMIWNFLHHHRLASAQVLAIVTTVMLPSLEANEFSTLIDHALDQFPLDGRWLQVLRVVSEMEAEVGTAPPSAAPVTARADEGRDDNGVDAVGESVRETRLKVLKKLFSMLSRQERESWLDKINAKYMTDAMKKRIHSLKQEASRKVEIVAAPEPLPLSLSDPNVHMPHLSVKLKMQWIKCLLDAITTDKENSARVGMLRHVLQPFLDGNTPAATASPTVSVVAVEKSILHLLNQLPPTEKAKLLLKIAPLPSLDVKPRLDRATSPVPELQDEPLVAVSLVLPTSNAAILSAFQSLVACKSEERVLQILREALVADEIASDDKESAATEPATQTRGLSMRLKRRISAVVAVAEPMEWNEHVKLGAADVACQTSNFEATPTTVGVDTISPLVIPVDKPAMRGSVLPKRMVPLTLSALLGRTGPVSPRKKDGKYQKLNSAAVPRSIGGLVTSWRMNADQLAQFTKKSLSAVLKTIADAYGEMLTAGRRKMTLPYAPTRSRELSLAQVVYQQFLHSYGLPGIADMHLLAFSCAIEAYRAQHLRVEYFARFCFEEVSKPELSNYLEFLECIVCDDMNVVATAAGNVKTQPPQAPPKRTRFVPRIAVPDKENWCISVDKAQEAAHLCFRAMRKNSVGAFCDRLVAVAALGTSSSADSNSSSTNAGSAGTGSAPLSASDLVINVDHLLQLVAHEWRDEQLRRDNYLLDAFRAGDVNGDGQLTSAEFSRIVLSIDRTRDLGDILLMFSETLRRTECDQIGTEVFLQVAKEYELDRVVWNEDGDLRNIVNDVSDLETTWGGVRGFFLGTLEALARDLQPTHFLRVCEGAGCGCLKCILDGYIGFQKMRHDFALAQQHQMQTQQGRSEFPSQLRRSPVAISESLVWARFWHLMRQLYDAAAESDGILTPWEGSSACVRASPATAMAPRLVARHRNALPNILFPDTNRISAKMRTVHDPEAFDADLINEQFIELLSRMTYKKPDAT